MQVNHNTERAILRQGDPMQLFTTQFKTPVGELFIAVDDQERVTRISFHEQASVVAGLQEQGYTLREDRQACGAVIQQLEAYFRKERQDFDVPLNLVGTPFQVAVWEQLCKIPYGTCIGYGDIANALGKPGSSRAVGMANNRNPIPIIVPCHRVIGSNGKLVGFGGGLDNKYQLLVHEGYFLI
jgi:methylated-DNA-[protein]-cysteine S-methyltransferase